MLIEKYEMKLKIYENTTRFPSFFPATAHTLKYERSEELGKNLALGGIYRLPKFLKISKQNKFPQKNTDIILYLHILKHLIH